MKKILMVLALVATVLVGFTSCSDDVAETDPQAVQAWGVAEAYLGDFDYERLVDNVLSNLGLGNSYSYALQLSYNSDFFADFYDYISTGYFEGEELEINAGVVAYEYRISDGIYATGNGNVTVTLGWGGSSSTVENDTDYALGSFHNPRSLYYDNDGLNAGYYYVYEDVLYYCVNAFSGISTTPELIDAGYLVRASVGTLYVTSVEFSGSMEITSGEDSITVSTSGIGVTFDDDIKIDVYIQGLQDAYIASVGTEVETVPDFSNFVITSFSDDILDNYLDATGNIVVQSNTYRFACAFADFLNEALN